MILQPILSCFPIEISKILSITYLCIFYSVILHMHYLNNFRYSERCRSFFAIIRPYVSIQFRQSNLGSDEITWKTKTSKVLSINTSPLHCLLNCDYNYLWQPKTFSCRLGFASMGRNDESALFFNASFSVFGPLRCP